MNKEINKEINIELLKKIQNFYSNFHLESGIIISLIIDNKKVLHERPISFLYYMYDMISKSTEFFIEVEGIKFKYNKIWSKKRKKYEYVHISEKDIVFE